MSTSSCPDNGEPYCPSPFAAGSMSAALSPMMMTMMTPPKNKILKWNEEKLFLIVGSDYIWDFEMKKRFVGGNMILSGDAWSFAYIVLTTNEDENTNFPSLPNYDMHLNIVRLPQLDKYRHQPGEWRSNFYDFDSKTLSKTSYQPLSFDDNQNFVPTLAMSYDGNIVAAIIRENTQVYTTVRIYRPKSDYNSWERLGSDIPLKDESLGINLVGASLVGASLTLSGEGYQLVASFPSSNSVLVYSFNPIEQDWMQKSQLDQWKDISSPLWDIPTTLWATTDDEYADDGQPWDSPFPYPTAVDQSYDGNIIAIHFSKRNRPTLQPTPAPPNIKSPVPDSGKPRLDDDFSEPDSSNDSSVVLESTVVVFQYNAIHSNWTQLGQVLRNIATKPSISLSNSGYSIALKVQGFSIDDPHEGRYDESSLESKLYILDYNPHELKWNTKTVISPFERFLFDSKENIYKILGGDTVMLSGDGMVVSESAGEWQMKSSNDDDSLYDGEKDRYYRRDMGAYVSYRKNSYQANHLGEPDGYVFQDSEKNKIVLSAMSKSGSTFVSLSYNPKEAAKEEKPSDIFFEFRVHTLGYSQKPLSVEEIVAIIVGSVAAFFIALYLLLKYRRRMCGTKSPVTTTTVTTPTSSTSSSSSCRRRRGGNNDDRGGSTSSHVTNERAVESARGGNEDNNESNEDVFADDVAIRMAVNESLTTDQTPSTIGQRDTMATTRTMNDDDEEEQVAVRPTFGQRLSGLFTINVGNDSTKEKKRGSSDHNAQRGTTTTTSNEAGPEASTMRSENVPQSINGNHDMKTALELAKALSISELENENIRNMERIDEGNYDDGDSLGQVGIEEEKEEIRSDWNDDEDLSFATRTNSMVARN